MSLRRITALIVILTVSVLLVTVYLSSHFILMSNLEKLEHSNTLKDVNRALQTVADEASDLDMAAAAWASWDDTYRFIQDVNPDYISANLANLNFKNLQINMVMYVDNNGNIVYGKYYDLQKGEELPLPGELVDMLNRDALLFHHTSTADSHTGLILLPAGPFLLASRPITTSQGAGPIRGTLVVGMLMDRQVMDRLASRTHLDLELGPFEPGSSPPAGHTFLTANWLHSLNYVEEESRELICGYAVLDDLWGNPAVRLKVTLDRNFFMQAENGMHFLMFFLTAAGAICAMAILLLLERFLVSRLLRLNRHVQGITDFNRPLPHLFSRGRDEVAQLTNSVNNMLMALNTSHHQIFVRDIQLGRLTENMTDTVSQVDIEGNFQYCSPSYHRLLGLEPDVLIGQSFFTFLHPEDRPAVQESFSRAVEDGQPGQFESRWLISAGDYLWLDTRVNVITDKTGDVRGAVLVGRDVTKRKLAEERLTFLSLHDSMTGLYNRTFFTQFLANLQEEQLPLALIVCDLDGLKLVNDTLGHDIGDELLITTARIVSDCLRKDDVLARIGGDEFAILLPNSNDQMAEQMYQDIKAAVVAFNSINLTLPLSLSLGWAIATRMPVNSAHLFREADNNMYREKLHSRSSGHSSIVTTLMQALQERDYITSGHADRMENLVAAMGEACNLPATRVNDLKLLARFHDIGKVGIPDSILNKPGTLSVEEYKEMQRHCEIGYRIAQTSPELVPIADWILKHHEWWNGHGYPLGLTEEDIPLECRILAIADAYDAMTSRRPYRAPLTHKEALDELNRCASTQFDPDLVKRFHYMWDTCRESRYY